MSVNTVRQDPRSKTGADTKKSGALALDKALKELKFRGEHRQFAVLERDATAPPVAAYHGLVGATVAQEPAPAPDRNVKIWCSNDYLGMSRSPVVADAMIDAIRKCGAGAGGTRNISGTSVHHVALEQALSKLHQKEAAAIFTSGYNANEAALGVLGKLLPNCIIFSDELNHASMIAGMKRSGAPKKIWRHNDIDHLRALLEEAPADSAKLIAMESVYSMDGDIGPLEAACDLAEEFGAYLYVDEVHAVGLYGEHGGGVSEQLGLTDRVDLIEGTLGKAYGVMGGYIAASKTIVDAVRSFAPEYIFSTALSPVLAAGALASVEQLASSNEERRLHRQNVNRLKRELGARGLEFMDGPSHIVPVIIGDPSRCVATAHKLLDEYDIYVQPIVYPTVPRGTERLRLTPSPFHDEQSIIDLCDALESVLEQI
ncbi:MAG: 5-aminolevulinate synthase [Hyphomonadaceae bacterium]